MLSRYEQELLTAYVDDELTARHRRQADRLLRRSGEARSFLADLQADADQIRSAPVLTIPVDLSDPLIDLIAQGALKPAPRQSPRPLAPSAVAPSRKAFTAGGTFPGWWGVAAAAAVLLLVGAASFLLHLSSGRSEPGKGLATRPNDSRPDGDRELVKGPRHQEPNKKNRTERPATPDNDSKDPPEGDPSLPPMPDEPGDEPGSKRPIAPKKEDKPENPGAGLLASGDREAPGKLERVEVALPTFLDIHKLDLATQADRLRQDLGKGQAFRLEILARDATRGFDRVRAALADRKITLHYDPSAQVRLKRPSWRTDYAVFVENLKVEDVLALLRAAGQADRQAGEKKAVEQRFEGTLVLKQLSRWDQKELTELLGIDPVTHRPAPPTGKSQIDIRRPLSEATEQQTLAALDGKGVPRPGSTPERGAYVTPLTGPRSRPADLKRYLETRKPAMSETIQVFLVIRNVGA